MFSVDRLRAARLDVAVCGTLNDPSRRESTGATREIGNIGAIVRCGTGLILIGAAFSGRGSTGHLNRLGGAGGLLFAALWRKE